MHVRWPSIPAFDRLAVRARIVKALRLQCETSRTLLAALFLFIAGIVCGISIQSSDWRWQQYLDAVGGSAPRLKDLLLDAVFLDLPKAADLFMETLLGITILMILIETRTARGRPDSYKGWLHRILIAIRRVCWITGMLYLGRSLIISLTLMPSPLPGCVPVTTFGNGPAAVLASAVKIAFGSTKACTDMIYSGHTMIMSMCAVQFRLYPRWRFVSYYGYVHATVGILFVGLTSRHYTIDLVLAVMVTLGIWSAYLALLYRAIEERRALVEWSMSLKQHRDGEEQAGWWSEAKGSRRDLGSTMVTRVVGWLDGVDLRWGELRKRLELPERTDAAIVTPDVIQTDSNSEAKSEADTVVFRDKTDSDAVHV